VSGEQLLVFRGLRVSAQFLVRATRESGFGGDLLGGDLLGGDLAGITAKINFYLKCTLGVTALYANPIFDSPSSHKYDTQHYMTVNRHFGSNADLQKLINTAHISSNTRILMLLDRVFNHRCKLI
jgi:alpha-glucosidase